MNHSSKEPTISIRDIKRRISSGDLEAERLMGLILLDGTGVKKNVNEGFRLLRESAERGDSTSECDVGFCFHTGQGTDFNCSEAIRYYQLSANHSNPKGHNNLGYCLFNGEGTHADQQQAALHFKISSDNNCPEGVCNYARCLEYGDGVPQDLPKAASLYKKAADLNNPHAMYCYGRCLSNGIGVPKNDQLAVQYFKQAADRHDEYGQLYYHLMLFKGRGIERDETTAATFFQREALAGNPHAQTYYGIALETGRGVAKVDINKASMQYRMAANNGDPHAQFCLGLLFRDGKGVLKSEAESLRLFKQAADNGYGRAMIVFANCLDEGIGLPKFKPGAVSYYKAAADKGKVVGQFKYGQFLEEGEYVEKNLSLAARYYKMAADQHYAEAEYSLGRFYELGKGVNIDISMAASLYKRAADQRVDRAEDRYGKCLQRGRGAPKSPVLSIDYFRRSASQKLAAGQYHLGRSFETGLGIPSGPDFTVAINNYKLAAAQKHPQAIYHLGLLYKNGVRMNNSTNTVSNSLNQYGKSKARSVKYPSETITKFMNYLNGKSEDENKCGAGERIVLEKDLNEAARLFKEAANLSHTKSLYEYGLCLLHGDGVSKDVEEAKKQFKRAAALDHADSMFLLALISKEIDKDEEAALKYLRDASEHDHPIAQCELGKLLYNKIKSSNENECESEMIQLFAKSAAAGYADAQFWLGVVIEEGKSINQTDENSNSQTVSNDISAVISSSSNLSIEQKAFTCFSLASKQSHPFATTRRGLYLLRGVGTETNVEEALEMFEKAANLGDNHAYFLLGRCHEFGDGLANEFQPQPPSNSLASNAAVPATKSTANINGPDRPTTMRQITKVKSNANINMNTNQNHGKNVQSPQRNPRHAHIANPGSNNSSASSSSIGSRPPTSSTQLPPMKDWIKYYEKAAEAKDPSALYSLGLLYARNIISITPSTNTNTNTNDNSDNSNSSNVANMERAAALFAESAALGSACGKMCYSCCIARGEGGVEKDMELAFKLASEAKEKGIHWTRIGRSPFEFEDETSFTRFLHEKDSSKDPKKNKDYNPVVNNAQLNPEESLADLEEAAKKGHQGAMFILSTTAKEINTPDGEKHLADAAPWIEKKAKVVHQEIKKRRPSLKKIQMTKKSITSHHKALITKPDGKHTFIVV